MKKKPRFLIGDWVKVEASISLYYDDNNMRQVSTKRHDPPKVGQIVGARIKMLGKFHSSHNYYSDDIPDYEPPYLEVKGYIRVWLIREGYLNTPIEAMDEDVALHEPIHGPCIRLTIQDKLDKKLPWRKLRGSFDEKQREELRKIMKTVPRDSKGRWVK